MPRRATAETSETSANSWGGTRTRDPGIMSAVTPSEETPKHRLLSRVLRHSFTRKRTEYSGISGGTRRPVPLAAWVFVWLGLILTFCAAVYAVPPLAIIGAACTISAIIVGWD